MKLPFFLVFCFVFCTAGYAQNEVVGENSKLGKLDQKPTYPSGLPAMSTFIKSNMVYPDSALNQSIQGKVLVKFVIDTTGSVAEATIVTSVHPLLDNEALRVVRLMNGWTPGKMKGHKVPVYYTLPINFKLP